MAKNEPNKPDVTKSVPGNKTLETGSKTTPHELHSGKADVPAHKGENVPQKTAKEQTGPPAPASGDVVVSFDQINKIISGKQAVAQKQSAPDKKVQKDPEKFEVKQGGDKPTKDEKADKAAKEPEAPKANQAVQKPIVKKADKNANESKAEKPANQKPAANISKDGSTAGKSASEAS